MCLRIIAPVKIYSEYFSIIIFWKKSNKHFKKLDHYNNEKGCIIFSDLDTERLFAYFSIHKKKEVKNGKVLYSLENKECNNQFLYLKKLNIQD